MKHRPPAVLMLALGELLLGATVGGIPAFWCALAAWSALVFRPWSYALFFVAVAGQALTSDAHLSAAFSAVMGSFLLAPGLRRAYFDARARWWESLPRYRLELSGIVETAEGAGFCQVVDASLGGMLIRLRSPRGLQPGETVKIVTGFRAERAPYAEPSPGDLRLAIHGVVIHSARKGQDLYGIRYARFDLATRTEVRRFILGCALRGFPCNKTQAPWNRLLLYMQIRVAGRIGAWLARFPYRLKIERRAPAPVSAETQEERKRRGSAA